MKLIEVEGYDEDTFIDHNEIKYENHTFQLNITFEANNLNHYLFVENIELRRYEDGSSDIWNYDILCMDEYDNDTDNLKFNFLDIERIIKTVDRKDSNKDVTIRFEVI